jgi:hypothetical protein
VLIELHADRLRPSLIGKATRRCGRSSYHPLTGAGTATLSAADPDAWCTLRSVDDQERTAIHERWAERLNRRTGDPGYHEQWYFQQCGGCLHWLALGGRLGADWGVCSGSASPFDGIARFEHDGCDHFAQDPKGFGITRG